MNTEYEKRLEERIDRELKELPELRAPTTLAARVMQAVEARARVPWYRQSWEMWPAPVRISALIFLLASFGGLCFASWQLTRAAGFANAMQEVGEMFSGFTLLWNIGSAVLSAAVLAVKQLGTGILITLLMGVLLAWAMCLGLGTICVRLALARR